MFRDAHRSELLTVKEAAAKLGQHPQTVRRKIARGEVPAIQLGGKGAAVRVDARELAAWLYADPGAASSAPAPVGAPTPPSPGQSTSAPHTGQEGR